MRRLEFATIGVKHRVFDHFTSVGNLVLLGPGTTYNFFFPAKYVAMYVHLNPIKILVTNQPELPVRETSLSIGQSKSAYLETGTQIKVL